MSRIISNRIFNKSDHVDFDQKGLTFEECTFQHYDFGKNNLSNIVFADCQFLESIFNMNDLVQTSFQNVRFVGCKMVGLHFSACNPMLLEIVFNQCKLDYCVFQNLKMNKIKLTSCSLVDADFYNANLKNAKVTDCDLLGAIFDNTILENADLTASCNFEIDPEMNYIEGATFSMSSLSGLLYKYRINIDD